MKETAQRVFVAAVTGGSVVLAATSDLASEGVSELQRKSLLGLLLAGVLLSVVTYLAIERLQSANGELQRRHNEAAERLTAQADELEKLRTDRQYQVGAVKHDFVLAQGGRLIRRLVTATLAGAETTWHSGATTWRSGVWSIEQGRWAIEPVESDNLRAHAPTEAWERPLLSALPIPIHNTLAAVEVAREVVSDSGQVVYYAIQIMAVGEAAAQQAALELRTMAKLVIDGLAQDTRLREHVVELLRLQ